MITNNDFHRGLPSSSRLHRPEFRRVNRQYRKAQAAKRKATLQKQAEQRTARSLRSEAVNETIKNLQKPSLMTRVMTRMTQFAKRFKG